MKHPKRTDIIVTRQPGCNRAHKLISSIRPLRASAALSKNMAALSSETVYANIGIMSERTPPKPLFWIASSKDDVLELSEDVRREVGFALYQAQIGRRHESVKTLKGFGGASVLEINADDGGGTYRTIYTVRFARAVYVLHVFQKKSTRGIATPRREIELVEQRLAKAAAHYKEFFL